MNADGRGADFLTLVETQSRARRPALDMTALRVFSDEPEGTVIAQNPGSGERVSKDSGRAHQRLQGHGPRRRSFGRWRQADAQAQLADLGLEANVFRVPSIEPRDTVVAQNPVGGQAKIGSAVA